MALSFFRDKEDAEKATQGAFIRVYRCLPSYRKDSEFAAWVIRVALYEIKEHLQQKETIQINPPSYQPVDGTFEFHALLLKRQEFSSDMFDSESMKRPILKVFEMLSAVDRQILLLSDVARFNPDHTAMILEISISLVRSRLHRARMLLQQLLLSVSAIGQA